MVSYIQTQVTEHYILDKQLKYVNELIFVKPGNIIIYDIVSIKYKRAQTIEKLDVIQFENFNRILTEF